MVIAKIIIGASTSTLVSNDSILIDNLLIPSRMHVVQGPLNVEHAQISSDR